uniref:Uncharacterized protein n=1 Tax=Arundo donax TaxID=35708 RepID=A0A0A9BR81_ARUDO
MLDIIYMIHKKFCSIVIRNG